MSQNRKPRSADTRDKNERPVTWRPSGSLPVPTAKDGWHLRYIRTSLYSEMDNRNVSKKFRDGWTPVNVEDYPELASEISDHGSKWGEKGHLEIGGQLLCQIPTERVEARQDYHAQMNHDQTRAVDGQLESISDPRMPILKPERKTQVSFGSGGG